MLWRRRLVLPLRLGQVRRGRLKKGVEADQLSQSNSSSLASFSASLASEKLSRLVIMSISAAMDPARREEGWRALIFFLVHHKDVGEVL